MVCLVKFCNALQRLDHVLLFKASVACIFSQNPALNGGRVSQNKPIKGLIGSAEG